MTIRRRDALMLLATAPLVPADLARVTRNGKAAAFIPANLKVEWRGAPIGIDTPRPRFSWRLTPKNPSPRGLVQTCFRVVVGSDPVAVQAARGNLWDSGVVESDRQRVAPPRDIPLGSHRRYWWSVRCGDADGWSEWSQPASFTSGVLQQREWPDLWIAAAPDRTLPHHAAGQAPADLVFARPLPLFRRRFALRDAPRRALVSVCGLGQYRLLVNGASVGETALTPGWTNYRRTVLYDTWDVTDALRRGENVLGLMLGNGMFNVEHLDGRYTKFLDSFGMPKAILVMTVEHRDGTIERVTSADGWRTHEGPIRFSSIYGGEDHDARLLRDGWAEPGFDDLGWTPALVVPGPGGTLRAAAVPPVIVGRSLAPASTRQIAPNVTLVDFGENFAGRPAIDFTAASGTQVTIVPGETLGANGRVDQSSFNAAPDRAVLFRCFAAGTGRERFEPLFSYHGFRYIEVHGLAAVEIHRIRGQALHADIERVGRFEAKVPLLGAIHRLIDNAVTSNMVSVLTDCPHREKLGWTEQTYLNAPTVFYNRDAITLYEKLVRDIAEAQQPDGMVPGIAPEYVAFVDGDGRDQIWRNSPEWGVAAVLSPWASYRFTGDASVLATGYPAARRYCDYLESRAVGGLVDFGMGDWYDIGPHDPGEAQLTSRVLTGTAVLIEALRTMAEIAPLAGHAEDVSSYQQRAAAIVRAFTKRFYDPASGRYDRGSQTAQAMPLALGIVPPPGRARVLERLIEAVRASGNGVTAGDIGFRYVISALAQARRDDVVFDMLNVRDRPSYASQLASGATTLTEAWDANSTKSQNHFMLGHAESWLYGRLGGIDVDHARGHSDALRIAPRVLAAAGGAFASHRLPEGVASCAWSLANGWLSMAVEVPPGRSATIVVPTSASASVRESGRVLERVAGLNVSAGDPAAVTIRTGSGRYSFTAAFAG